MQNERIIERVEKYVFREGDFSTETLKELEDYFDVAYLAMELERLCRLTVELHLQLGVEPGDLVKGICDLFEKLEGR